MSIDIFEASIRLPKLRRMTSTTDLQMRRDALLQRLFPDGVPVLWCPLLTHYDEQGRIDAQRIARHLDFLAPAVRGFLVPGSTGDGWELSDAEARTLLETVMPLAGERRLHLLIGVLKPETAAMQAFMADTIAWLKRRCGSTDIIEALRQAAAVGFTFCAPHGATLTQRDITTAFDTLLAEGAPTALYQLPQVTSNEVAPETVRTLAARHANLLMLKDTSGGDRVADAGGASIDELFLVRGAEGGYSRHLKLAGGRYDGFLLSTANVFGAQLAQLIEQLRQGRRAEADALSARLEAVVNAVFAAAAPLPYGNAFTNANKALDHFMAHGPDARRVTPPRLHSGQRLPVELIERAGDELQRHGLLPTGGYLND